MSLSNQKPLIVIPAAGFGRRLGRIGSKELMPSAKGPLIQAALDFANNKGWPIHLITRLEKTDLIEYCKAETKTDLHIQIVEPTQEWPQTVLQSMDYWHDNNLLFLPDLVFATELAVENIVAALDQNNINLAVAGMKVDDSQNWGCVRFTLDGLDISEKPLTDKSEIAWGFLAFRKSIGQELFFKLLESSADHQWKAIKGRVHFIALDKLQDPTRQSQQ